MTKDRSKMTVWLYENKSGFLNQLLLFDGSCTYWSDEMKPSTGYKRGLRTTFCPLTKGRFVYIGEL